MNRHDAIAAAITALSTIDPPDTTNITPTMLQSIAVAINDIGAFTHGAKTSFTPGQHRALFSVIVEGSSIQRSDRNDPTSSATYLRLAIYGEMTYDSRTDNGATVIIHMRAGQDIFGHGHATAWNGHKYVELPDGARRTMAGQVVDVVNAHLASIGVTVEQAVEVIGRQHAEGEYERQTLQLIGDALNALGKASGR